jgi:hypothetical protein
VAITAVEKLKDLLSEIPSLQVIQIREHEKEHDKIYNVDFTMRVKVREDSFLLACEVKSNGQPRFIRPAIIALHGYANVTKHNVVPVVIAPYLSPEVQEMCREHKINYLDFEGNAHIAFDYVYIERQVSSKPVTEKRGIRSLFQPKSAQVLRVLFRDPQRTWRVKDLAAESNVSLGHVSNVRTALLNREWAALKDAGIYLSKPEDLLEAWRKAYTHPEGELMQFYTTLHGQRLEDSIRNHMSIRQDKGLAIMASFTASQWLAPYGRTGMSYFYADHTGVEKLKEGLQLQLASKGANVVIIHPRDEGLFMDTIEPAKGAICTSPIQTYLDLSVAGERGQEAAEYLKAEWMKWKK